MPKCYPVSLNIEKKRCLVVGGGNVAERKVKTLLEYGAAVTLAAPDITAGLQDLVQSGNVTYIKEQYKREHLEGIFLVIGATDDEGVNAKISADCMEKGLLVNIVDDPPNGNFYVPAVVRRGPLQIAVSTDGKSPMLARRIREQLQRDYPEAYGEVIEFIGGLRERVINEIKDSGQKERILSSMVDSVTMDLLRQGKFDLAKERIMNAYTGSGGQPQDGSS
ncbi:MAG: precorrin-2 dehydrogenase/sirohydrochlorin ferrochelatase family protein [Bacillota bacterium]